MHPQTLEPIIALSEAASEKRVCSHCGQSKVREDYVSDREWRHSDRKCKDCRAEEKAAAQQRADAKAAKEKRVCS